MAVDHAARRDRLRTLIAERLGDRCALITDLPNIRYLTGFSGSNAVLVVGVHAAQDLLGTDGRYVDQATAECPGLPLVIDRETLRVVLESIAASLRGAALVVEESVPIGELQRVRSIVGEPVVGAGLVEELRAIKDVDELSLLDRACAITAAALESLVSTITVGDTEVAVARRLEQLFGELGADDRAFATIVATGEHSAIPHHRPTPAPLTEGDLLVIDAGAMVAGYHADMTRTFVVGAPPASWQSELHDAVEEAQRRAITACEVGIDARAVDEVARVVLRERGVEERFTHGLGHGVGLVIHEAPALGTRATGSIHRNMAFTVEPGAYLPGRGGVRIEDTLVATDAGPRVLTESPRELRVIGV